MQANSNDFPYEIREVDPESAAEQMKLFTGLALTGDTAGYVQVGPKGYFFPMKYREQAADIYNMAVRPDDLFVLTFARSGTTLTQEMAWLIANQLDYEKAKASLGQRWSFVEHPVFFDPLVVKRLMAESSPEENVKSLPLAAAPLLTKMSLLPSPRFIKSHLPLSLLPPALLDSARALYVARDPRDVAVSFYHHNRLIKLHGYVGDFKTYWNYFIQNRIYYAPYFEHVKEAWNLRHHPNMLFIFYEDMVKDLPGSIQRVAEFLGKGIDDQQIARLAEHLHIDNFRKNDSVNGDNFKKFGVFNSGEESFIRKGKVGDWRNYFDEEMTAQAERWVTDNLEGSDLKLPSFP